MFHTILTLSYLIPGIYTFLRIWQLFIAGKDRFLYTLIFLFLFLIYPLNNIFDEGTAFSDLLEKTSNYLLPFFLYIFLLVLATDLVLLINLITGIVSKKRMSALIRNYRFLLGIMLLSAVIVIAGVINFNTIRFTKYNIELDRTSSKIDKLRIAFVSDFHLEPEVPVRFIEQYIRKIKASQPDLLLYGGDILEGSGEDLATFESMLRTVNTKYGVYGVLGNHDRIRNLKDNFFNRAGITLLIDSTLIIDSSFVIAGRDDNRNMKQDAAGLLKDIPDLPVIVIDHRPTDFDNISKTGADLVFSGHTHNGQMFPINLYLKNIYELTHGHMKKADTHFIVSSGIRLWGPRVRTTGKSEIVLVEVIFR
jgi:predicted MPP superfamily phosphohydrolase